MMEMRKKSDLFSPTNLPLVTTQMTTPVRSNHTYISSFYLYFLSFSHPYSFYLSFISLDPSEPDFENFTFMTREVTNYEFKVHFAVHMLSPIKTIISPSHPISTTTLSPCGAGLYCNFLYFYEIDQFHFPNSTLLLPPSSWRYYLAWRKNED